MNDSDIHRVNRDFWETFDERISERVNSPLYVGAEQDLAENYLPQDENLPEGVNYSVVSNSTEEYFQVKFHIWDQRDDRDELFEYLRRRKGDIEALLGKNLDFTRNDGIDTIILERDGDITDRDRWEDYLDWLIRYGEAFHLVFGTHLNEYERDR